MKVLYNEARELEIKDQQGPYRETMKKRPKYHLSHHLPDTTHRKAQPWGRVSPPTRTYPRGVWGR